ncbi:hypothetical protein LWF15_33465 [Kineosporia rhizophila]|uniref:hypothetical protein n=1 Tax=Kineosporia rhizophila TaxID=84633 RepID=UPI001E422497|nr:hypothetical protein [Kineosporia rhizophila]MCE0540414.1 hypothetical protein [Kineosporia rhizophila]
MKITTYTTRTREAESACSTWVLDNEPREDEHEFDDADQVIDYLKSQGIQEPSSYPVLRINVRSICLSSLDSYAHPEGYTEEVSAHPGEGIDEATWAHIIKHAAWPARMDGSDL